jgi:two-component system sensor histidine kinase QseC
LRFRITDRLNSISVKVLLAFVVGMVLSVSLIALVLVTAVVFKSNIFSELEVNDAAQHLAEALQFNAEDVPTQIEFDDDYDWLFESLSQEVAYRVLDQSGTVVLYSAAGASFWSAVNTSYSLTISSFEFKRDGILMDAATGRVKHGGQIWFVQIAASRRFIHFAHDAFGFSFIESGLMVLFLVLLFVFGTCAHFTLKHTLKPLRELSESAALISPRSLQARLKNDNVPTEIAPLVNSFNHTLERLEHGYRVQQEFLSTAAHELKTPLALIRAQLELMPETEQRNWLLHDVSYMSRQVQQLLLLAEASEQQNYKFIPVDVPQAVAEAVAYLQRMANTAKVKLNLELHASGLMLQADKGGLFTLLKNLLENAIQHAPEGSAVSVDVFSDNITVRDHGPGIEDAQLPKLFDRFWRGAHKRDTGAGLGLTICREIALAHGWALSAHRMQPGLMFRLQLHTDNGVNVENGNALA